MRKNSFSLSLYIILFLVFISTIQISLADIDIKDLKDSYNIGEEININASIKHDKNFYGFINFEIKCGSKTTSFYKTPIKLNENELKIINDVYIILTKDITDNKDSCKIYSKLTDIDNNEIFNYKTNSFNIEDSFDLNININKEEFSAGETVEFEIDFDISDFLLKDLTADIIIDKNLKRYEIDSKNTILKYQLPSNIKSGTYTATIQIDDKFGNKGEEKFEFFIESIINDIRVMYLNKKFDATKNETITFKSIIFDQGNSFIDDKTINIKIINPNNKEIANKDIFSTHKFNMDIDETFIPGKYIIISTYKNLSDKTSFEIINPKYIVTIDREEKIINNESNISNIKDDTKENNTSIDKENDNYNKWQLITLLLALYILFNLYMKNKIKINKFLLMPNKNKFKNNKFFGIKNKKDKKKEFPKKIKANPKFYKDDYEF